MIGIEYLNNFKMTNTSDLNSQTKDIYKEMWINWLDQTAGWKT